MNQRTLLRFY